jgi:ATP-dependent Clp protease ATP-binding subunit ClpX
LGKRASSNDAPICSFCHKSQNVVGKLISSPSDYARAFICDECIAVCHSIIEDATSSPSQDVPQAAEIPYSRDELHAMLDDVPESDLATVRKILLALIREA